MDHYSDSYGTPEAQGIQKSLLEGEINIVENIKNYDRNKSAIIGEKDALCCGAPEKQGSERSLFKEELNVVENIKNYEKNKSNIIEKADSEIRMCDLTAAQESQREEIKKAIIDVEEAEY